MRRLLVIGSILLFTAGCSEPPQKEIDQAQSAVESARAAGAERYATPEFTAAKSSLDKARAAVQQRDYRQALNYAIDARQRASEAITVAADGKVRAKRTVDAQYADVTSRANRLQSALQTAAAGGAQARALRPVQSVLHEARADLQKASAAISAGNLEDAARVLSEVRGKLDAALSDVQKIPLRPARRTPRRGR